MKWTYVMWMTTWLAFVSCNESGRGNDSNLNEERNKAAAESNADKFAAEKQQDANFVYEAVASNYGEIKLSELANQKSRTSEVREIALRLQADHTALLNELKTLAQAKAISVPVEEPDASKRRIESIAKVSGSDFDKEWCKEMKNRHEKNIKEFEKRQENTEDGELKLFISKTLPVLKEHHQVLKSCQEKLKDNK
jgi:putative membrane protein